MPRNILALSVVDKIIGGAPYMVQGGFADCIWDAKALGYDGIELNISDPDRLDLPAIRQALAETGVQENDRVTVTPARIKKLESRSFKTESGIEIRIPAELCSSDDAVEFIHSATGGLSLLIKDVLV